MGRERIELSRYRYRQILSLVRLPVSPSARIELLDFLWYTTFEKPSTFCPVPVWGSKG